MLVRDIINTKGQKVVTLNREKSLQEAANAMTDNKIGAVVVTDDKNSPVGIFTERDLMHTGAKRSDRLQDIRLDEEMTPDVFVCLPDENLESVLAMMSEKRLRHMPVFEGGEMIGIVSSGDIVRTLLQQHKYEIHHLRDYISGKY